MKRLTGLLLGLCAFGCLMAAGAEDPRRVSTNTVKQTLNIDTAAVNGGYACFSNAASFLNLQPGRRRIDINGIVYWLNAAPTLLDWKLTEVDLDLISLVFHSSTNTVPRPLKVVIDAGHGGEDEGALGVMPCIAEKELNLTIAEQVCRALDTNYFNVVMTRTNDVTMSLSNRTAFAASQKADLFISIHGNYSRNRSAAGIETFVFCSLGFPGSEEGASVRPRSPGHQFDFLSTAAGYAVHRRMVAEATLLTQSNVGDRGLKRSNFFVLREAKCPAMLLEVGFLSNDVDGMWLTNTVYQATLAQAIANGVKDYACTLPHVEERMAAIQEREAAMRARWAAAAKAKKDAAAAKLAAAKPVETNIPEVVVAAVTVAQPIEAEESLEAVSDGLNEAEAAATSLTNQQAVALIVPPETNEVTVATNAVEQVTNVVTETQSNILDSFVVPLDVRPYLTNGVPRESGNQ